MVLIEIMNWQSWATKTQLPRQWEGSIGPWSMVVNKKIIMASSNCSSTTSVAGGMMLVSPPTVAMSLEPGTVWHGHDIGNLLTYCTSSKALWLHMKPDHFLNNPPKRNEKKDPEALGCDHSDITRKAVGAARVQFNSTWTIFTPTILLFTLGENVISIASSTWRPINRF